MNKIQVTQKNWNGKGDNRTFTYWVKTGQVALKLRDISRAYNMDNTEVAVTYA